MWKSFDKALEKRVRRQKLTTLDDYTIKKACEKAFDSFFGSIGRENIEILYIKKDKLFLNTKKSIWRTEIKLVEKQLICEINLKLNRELIKRIIITS